MRRITQVLGAGAALLLTAMPAVAQETHRLTGERVAIYNLAGRVDVVAGTGPDVIVRLTRGGADAEQLRIETGPIVGRTTLRVIYPDNEVVYADRTGRNGRGGRFQSELRVRPDGTFGEGGRGGERVTVTGRGTGLEAWADLRIEVPAGRSVEIYEAVGEADVRSVQGNIRIDVGSGGVSASGVRGALSLETGSGSVTVSDVDGELDVETGSGSVEITGVRGPAVMVDTGSGAVRGSDITSPTLHVDTGSGAIRLARVSSPQVVLDTGSGEVDVELLDRVDDLLVDTGSGSVTLYLPSGLGAEIEAETGSGGIDVEVPVQIRSVKRDHLLGRIGDGRGRISIDTGSGAIRLLEGR
jgi:lia operon protein LiaG